MAKDNKTIGVTVRFWTNDLPEKVGGGNGLIPCWLKGSVAIEANRARGIKACSEVFQFEEDIPRAIRVVMAKSKVAGVEDIRNADNARKKIK